MPLLRRRSVFAAKTETTVGTAESITSAEGAYNARDVMIQPSIAVTRREGQGGFNYLAGIPEGMMGTCTIVHDLAYDGTTIPTWASVLLPACGWVDTAGTFSPVSQGPGSGGVKTVTLAHYKDGKQIILSGCMGTFTITCPTGKVAFITFTFTGKYSTNETDTAIVAPTYPTTLPMRFAPGVLTWNSVNLCTSTVTVDAGNSRSGVRVGGDTGPGFTMVDPDTSGVFFACGRGSVVNRHRCTKSTTGKQTAGQPQRHDDRRPDMALHCREFRRYRTYNCI